MNEAEYRWAEHWFNEHLPICGCGRPEDKYAFVRDLLRDMPLYEDGRWQKYESPAAEIILDVLNEFGLLEHGGTAAGSWLTDDGRRMLAVLGNETTFAWLVDPVYSGAPSSM